MLQRTQTELFDKAIDRTFNIAWRAGIVPPPPPELSNQQLRVEYISPLFAAQKSVAGVVIERMATFAGNIAQFSPEALDKFDADQAMDEYADAIGVSPNIILSDDEVLDVRQQRERQLMMQQAAAMAAPAKDATQAVKNLADAEQRDGSALDGLTGAIQQAGGQR